MYEKYWIKTKWNATSAAAWQRRKSTKDKTQAGSVFLSLLAA